MAPTTAVMKALLMRKASRCLRAVLGLKSNMKLWLILVLFHMNKLQPYKNMCRLISANMLHDNDQEKTLNYNVENGKLS